MRFKVRSLFRHLCGREVVVKRDWWSGLPRETRQLARAGGGQVKMGWGGSAAPICGGVDPSTQRLLSVSELWPNNWAKFIWPGLITNQQQV